MDCKDITKSGIHYITEPIEVPDGTHLHAEPGCRLVGGKKLDVYEIGDGLWAADLAKAGITPAPFVSRGFGRKISPSHNELFINGRPMFIAQYPKRGSYLTIKSLGAVPHVDGETHDGDLADGFYYDDARPGEWKAGQEIWMLGYWEWDWNPTRERLLSVDGEKRFVKVDVQKGSVTAREDQRFCFYNVREEVTDEGDYCIDFEEKMLYFRPYGGTDMAAAEVILSTSVTPAFAFDGAKDIELDGFTIEAFCGMGITVKNSENIIVRGCEIKNIGNRAVCVDDTNGMTVTDCHIHDTGDGGVAYYCGDRLTLTEADCRVTYSHFHDIAKWDRCYEPPIRLYGVGLSAKYNHIHDCPHAAILFGGNEISITDNEVHHVVLETGDAGAIYGGLDYTFRGNEVSHNFIHHVGSVLGLGAMGIYNDDAISGTRMAYNVFYKVQRACFMGGGIDFVVDGNVFVDCFPAIEIDGRGNVDVPMWRRMVYDLLYHKFYSINGSDVKATDDVYMHKYPELKKIDDYYRADPKPFIPAEALMQHNIFCDTEKINYSWASEGGYYTEYDNIEVSRDELPKYLTPHQLEIISKE